MFTGHTQDLNGVRINMVDFDEPFPVGPYTLHSRWERMIGTWSEVVCLRERGDLHERHR